MERVDCLGLPNCFRLANGTAEAIVTTDVGPRILRYALLGQDNLLGEVPDEAQETELGTWKPWGGHRLWTAPEAMPRSYAPDNDPIAFDPLGDLSIRLRQPPEPSTGIAKTLTVTLAPEGTALTVHHQLTNTTLWPIPLAPWALTILAGGGTVLLPQEPYRAHGDYLLPARPLVLWHYTDLSDPRYTFGPRYLQLRTDAARDTPQKIGIANKQGWAAYLRQGTLFVKTFPYHEHAAYPDSGCNCETFTRGLFVEVESLGPLQTLEPGAAAKHVEHWSLHPDVDVGEDEDSLDAALRPLVQRSQAE